MHPVAICNAQDFLPTLHLSIYPNPGMARFSEEQKHIDSLPDNARAQRYHPSNDTDYSRRIQLFQHFGLSE